MALLTIHHFTRLVLGLACLTALASSAAISTQDPASLFPTTTTAVNPTPITSPATISTTSSTKADYVNYVQDDAAADDDDDVVFVHNNSDDEPEDHEPRALDHDGFGECTDKNGDGVYNSGECDELANPPETSSAMTGTNYTVTPVAISTTTTVPAAISTPSTTTTTTTTTVAPVNNKSNTIGQVQVSSGTSVKKELAPEEDGTLAAISTSTVAAPLAGATTTTTTTTTTRASLHPKAVDSVVSTTTTTTSTTTTPASTISTPVPTEGPSSSSASVSASFSAIFTLLALFTLLR